jgi:hypothetical protein
MTMKGRPHVSSQVENALVDKIRRYHPSDFIHWSKTIGQAFSPERGSGHRLLMQRLARLSSSAPACLAFHRKARVKMNNIIYIVGLVVVVIAVLSFFGLR